MALLVISACSVITGVVIGLGIGRWLPMRSRRISDWLIVCATEKDAAKYSRKTFIRFNEGPTARTTSGQGPTTAKPDILPKGQGPRPGSARWFINNAAQIAECGGPCTFGPSHCDCGAVWVDVPHPINSRA